MTAAHFAFFALIALAQPPAADEQLADLVLVKASTGAAVVRFGKGPLRTIHLDDRLGATKAVVKAIAAGRLELEETFTGRDGKPNRALIVIKEGERGGTRYLQRPDEPNAVGTKPLIVPAGPDAKPAPKKPPQM
jgi:hypothetical protein